LVHENTLLKSTINFTVVALLNLPWAGSALATTNAENALLSVGLKAKAATTAKQKQELKTLPQGTVSRVTQKEKTFYVYPDVASQQLYVGSEAQYQAYESRGLKDAATPSRSCRRIRSEETRSQCASSTDSHLSTT